MISLCSIIERHLIALLVNAIRFDFLIAEESDCFKISAKTESTFTDGGNQIRDGYILQVLAVVEGKFSDRGD